MPFLMNRAASSALTTLPKSDFRRIRSLYISFSFHEADPMAWPPSFGSLSHH
jgi:hypothetical protein